MSAAFNVLPASCRQFHSDEELCRVHLKFGNHLPFGHPIPLTPALSHREREKRIPPLDNPESLAFLCIHLVHKQ